MTMSVDLCVGWQRVGMCAGAEFQGVVRHLAAGEWSLVGAVAGVELQAGYTLADVDTVLVLDGMAVAYSGIVGAASTGSGGLQIVDTGDGQMFNLAGTDAWSLLASRIVYPTPGTVPPWADAFDVRTGLASTVAAGFVSANLGPTALVARQLPSVSTIDGAGGISGTWSGRLQPLDQLVARVCAEGGIVCRPTVDAVGHLTVLFGAPTDRSASVVLSDKGDLSSIDRRYVPPTVTFAVAGGAGAGASRSFVTSGTAAGGARFETFTDQTSLTTTELGQAANYQVAAGVGAWSIHAEIAVGSVQHLTYGTDFQVGDFLAVELDSVRYPVQVTAVTFESTATRSLIRPVLGDAAPNPTVGLLRDVANLAARLNTGIA